MTIIDPKARAGRVRSSDLLCVPLAWSAGRSGTASTRRLRPQRRRTARRRRPPQARSDSSLPSLAGPPKRIVRRRAGPRRQDVRNGTLASRAGVRGALIHRCRGRGHLRQIVATIQSGICGRVQSHRRSRAKPFFASDTFPNEFHQGTNARAQRGVSAASGA